MVPSPNGAPKRALPRAAHHTTLLRLTVTYVVLQKGFVVAS